MEIIFSGDAIKGLAIVMRANRVLQYHELFD